MTDTQQNPSPAPFDARRRLKELLSIPERDRTDEQWDEIVELEIQLAPGNRVHPNQGHHTTGSGSSNNSGGGKGQPSQNRNKHRPKGPGGGGNNRRPPKPKPPSTEGQG